MKSYPASVGIFQGKTEEKELLTTPQVPSEVFEVAQKIEKQKEGCELVETRSGLYIVQYNPTGPFKEEVNDEWMSVRIIKLRKWQSGGIKKKELEDFLSSPPDSAPLND
jgi:hypothetical protein